MCEQLKIKVEKSVQNASPLPYKPTYVMSILALIIYHICIMVKVQ